MSLFCLTVFFILCLVKIPFKVLLLFVGFNFNMTLNIPSFLSLRLLHKYLILISNRQSFKVKALYVLKKKTFAN